MGSEVFPMLKKELNKKQDPLPWAGVVFAGVFFIDITVRHLMGKGFDPAFSVVLALALGIGYYIFATLNNRRLHKQRGRKKR